MFSFSKQKKKNDLFRYVRRICDLTTPNLAQESAERSEDRFNRTIPTVICPWEEDRPTVERAAIGLTSDLADRGVQVILNRPFMSEHIVLGYWIAADDMEEPWYFLGTVRRNQPIGGGYWALGVELVEFANDEHRRQLDVLKTAAGELLPPEAMLA